MSSQKKIGIAIFAALAIGVGGYFGYQHYASVPTAQEAVAAVDKIGVIDFVRAVKGHPRAAELEAIEYAMADLQSSAQQKMQRGMAMSMPSGLPMEISNNMTAGQQALIAEANQKIAAKQTELSKRIAEIGLAKEKARDEELAVSLRQISDEYKLRIFNYDLKLQALTLDDASRAKMEEEKNALERELFFKQQAKTNEM
ncbi:MAG: hypothetical protein J6B02_01545, partial [Selenomonadales bacterium]|nr:hypothetical protein [Selenomonadales bacterium]